MSERGWFIGAEICEALGLTPKKVRRMTLRIDPTDVITVDVELLPDADELKNASSVVGTKDRRPPTWRTNGWKRRGPSRPDTPAERAERDRQLLESNLELINRALELGMITPDQARELREKETNR